MIELNFDRELYEQSLMKHDLTRELDRLYRYNFYFSHTKRYILFYTYILINSIFSFYDLNRN